MCLIFYYFFVVVVFYPEKQQIIAVIVLISLVRLTLGICTIVSVKMILKSKTLLNRIKYTGRPVK